MLKIVPIAILSTCGCVQISTTNLPAYSLAMSMQGQERPKLFYAEAVDWNSMPAMTPYAVVTGVRGSKESIARRIWQEGAKLKADVVAVFNRGTVYTGTVNTYYGFGISTSEPVYAQVFDGVCYRVNQARLGFVADETSMVTVIEDDGCLRAAGLLEGDRLLSINGMPFDGKQSLQSAGARIELLKLKPGDNVKLVWIRPGSGRMEGVAKAVENRRSYVDVPDSIPWRAPRPEDDDTRYKEGNRYSTQ